MSSFLIFSVQCLDPYEQCPSLPVDKIFPFMQNANLLTKQMFAYDVICGSQGKGDKDTITIGVDVTLKTARRRQATGLKVEEA